MKLSFLYTKGAFVSPLTAVAKFTIYNEMPFGPTFFRFILKVRLVKPG